MATEKRTTGTGLTAQEVTTYSEADMESAFGRWAGDWNALLAEKGNSFEAAFATTIELWRARLRGAADPPHHPDSLGDFAARIVDEFEFAAAQVRQGNSAEAARSALAVGYLIALAEFKFAHEAAAVELYRRRDQQREAAPKGGEATRNLMWKETAIRAWEVDRRRSAYSIAKEIIGSYPEGTKPPLLRAVIRSIQRFEPAT